MTDVQPKYGTISLMLLGVAINWILFSVLDSMATANMAPSLQLILWSICTLLACQIVFLFTVSALQQPLTHVLMLALLICSTSSLSFYTFVKTLPFQAMLNNLCAVFTLMTGLFGVLLHLKRSGAQQQTLLFACLGFWVFTASPLWLGGLFEIGSLSPESISLLASGTPLALLAAGVGYQYLTNPWFYHHTPLGMMYYHAIPLSTLLLYYMSANALFWISLALWRRPKKLVTS